MTDYYEVLNLTKKASHSEIKQSYKQLALVHFLLISRNFILIKTKISKWPKLNFTKYQKLIQVINFLTIVLNDPKKREKYDLYGVR
jgi:DnaJ-class molecular chaperone